jgi:predicted ATPase
LLLLRAQAVKPSFAMTPDIAPLVEQICQRLDGLPLAIELAAARIRLFPLAALLQRLDRRLALLTGGAYDLPARHQTLRATIEWSYQLLDTPARTLLQRLAVFEGSFTLESAKAVCEIADDSSQAQRLLPVDQRDNPALALAFEMIQHTRPSSLEHFLFDQRLQRRDDEEDPEQREEVHTNPPALPGPLFVDGDPAHIALALTECG